jgi:hypothetical protein
MARFEKQLPKEILKDFELVYNNVDKMLGDMTRAGAEVAMNNIKANMPPALKDNSEIMGSLRLTKTYKTPSDDGINTQAMFNGYFINKDGKKTPIPLVVNMFEFGSRSREYPKHPFFRKSFRKGPIEKAMLDVQKKYIKGD